MMQKALAVGWCIVHYGAMRPHKEIVSSVGSDRLAEHFDVSINTVRSWVQRDRIPFDLWPDFVSNEWTTLEELTEGAQPRQRKAAA